MLTILVASSSAIARHVTAGATRQVALREMQEIRQAVLRFQEDTGFRPNEGPFDLGARSPSGWAWPEIPAIARADLGQLLENPLAGTSHTLAEWNADTGRGWHGPYLARNAFSRFPTGVSIYRSDGRQDSSQTVVGIADAFSKAVERQDAVACPYLLLDVHDAATARVLCFGPNRRFDGGQADDLVLFIR